MPRRVLGPLFNLGGGVFWGLVTWTAQATLVKRVASGHTSMWMVLGGVSFALTLYAFLARVLSANSRVAGGEGFTKVSFALFFIAWVVLLFVCLRTNPDPMAPIARVLGITTDSFEERLKVKELVDEAAGADQSIWTKTRGVFRLGLHPQGDGEFDVDQAAGDLSVFTPGMRFPATGRTNNQKWPDSFRINEDDRGQHLDIWGKVHFPADWARVNTPTRITGHLGMPCQWPYVSGHTTFSFNSGLIASEPISFIMLPHTMQGLMREAKRTSSLLMLFDIALLFVLPWAFWPSVAFVQKLA